MKQIITILFLFSVVALHAQPKKGIRITGSTPIYTSCQPGDPVYKAVQALQRDMERILGKKPVIKSLDAIGETGIVIVNSAKDKIAPKITGWESHKVFLRSVRKHPHLILQGADTRGTIYAVYSFSESVLGVPPLWYFSSWQPSKRGFIDVNQNFALQFKSPEVKYRAWFPNDTDLFEPWRKRSADNYELWLETALRLKLNTIEWFDDERDYANPYSVSKTTRLVQAYGLINTTHHHSPLNASFAGWNDYWKKTRDTVPPELSLANTRYLEEFWRYNIESIVRNKIDMLWVIGFRGMGDNPFWYTFKDAPESMQERGKIISEMLERQRKIVAEVTGNPAVQTRTIFYDELSDLLAQGHITAPNDPNFIWTYVAARRDHFPNQDMQQLDKSKNLLLGYYFNYQFTSTGSHLAAGEGPWKMEKNFRFVAGKSKKPIAFSVVNAGNLREFMLELAANATMMWNFKSYDTDSFLEKFSSQYFGSENASKTASLIKNYYKAYWTQRKPELQDFDRQFIFQDLRYKRALMEVLRAFNKPYDPNPLTDIPAEQLKGRTYRILPENNDASNQIDAVLNGTRQSAAKFKQVAADADKLHQSLLKEQQLFFNDMVRQPAHYMAGLNEALYTLALAYKTTDPSAKKTYLQQSYGYLKEAQSALLATQQGVFENWYKPDRIFGFTGLMRLYEQVLKDRPNVVIILADDMGYSDLGCYGSEIATPSIDALAKNGIRFTNMYTNAWCSPSRASLMTGLYPHQAGMGVLAEQNPGKPGPYQGYLNSNCITLAEVLKASGYATSLSGKWHLGDQQQYWPANRGFDHAFGLISGASNYYDLTKAKSTTVKRKMALNQVLFIPPDSNFYMTDAITDDAVSQMKKLSGGEQPFFMYVAYTAPHWPLHALQKDIETYKGNYAIGWDSLRQLRIRKQQAAGIPQPATVKSFRDAEVTAWSKLSAAQRQDQAARMEVYAAQVDRMDQGIGRILQALQESGKVDNTIVIFLSDNSASAEGGLWGFDLRKNNLPPGGEDSYMSYGQSWANLSNTPFNDYKKTLREGGVLTPMIIQWPKGMNGEIKGSVVNQVAHLVDIMPTICALTGASYPAIYKQYKIQPMEGESFSGLLKEGEQTERSPIYWGLQERRSMRMGHYKLEAPDGKSSWQLYDLQKDRTQLNDIFKDQPEIAARMVSMWTEWANRVRIFDGQPKNTAVY